MCQKIFSPKQLKNQLPLQEEQKQFINQSRWIIKNIISKKDSRFLVIVWPCSIHDIQQALEYAKRLKEISTKYPNLYVVMRTYFEKPRTTVWWKWLIQDPNLDCSNDIEKGLFLARNLLIEVAKMELPSASELLEPLQVEYYQDLVCYGAIWARTTESQVHREMASGLDFAVGFKNWTDGNVDVAINWILSSNLSHTFLSIDENWQVCKKTTQWNKYSHIILRWWANWPNYDSDFVKETFEKLNQAWISTWIIIDASHWNSGKKALNQIKVVENILEQKNKNVVWVMIESNINFWNQSFNPCKDKKEDLKYGISITDECISLAQTEQLLDKISKSMS